MNILFTGSEFKDHPVELKGNNDILVLTKPEVISEIHSVCSFHWLHHCAYYLTALPCSWGRHH